MNNPKELYHQYKEIAQRAADFSHAAAVLEWDQEVYMPPKGFAFRGGSSLRSPHKHMSLPLAINLKSCFIN